MHIYKYKDMTIQPEHLNTCIHTCVYIISNARAKLNVCCQTLTCWERRTTSLDDYLYNMYTDMTIQQEQMFMYAVKHGHAETVEQLLLKGLKADMQVVYLFPSPTPVLIYPSPAPPPHAFTRETWLNCTCAMTSREFGVWVCVCVCVCVRERGRECVCVHKCVCASAVINETHLFFVSLEIVHLSYMSHMSDSKHSFFFEIFSKSFECESCLTYECVMSHLWMDSRRAYQWVVSYLWMSHVTYMDRSRHTYEWVTSHIWMSRVTHMNESRHTYEWVMSHIWMSRVTHMSESRHTYEWVMSHIWMSHVTHMNESRHIYEWVMSHMNESCLTYE